MCCGYRSEVLSEKTAGEPVVEVAVLQVGGSTTDRLIQQISTRCSINLCIHFNVKRQPKVVHYAIE